MDGPDKIIPADQFTTYEPDGAVKLRLGDSEPESYTPISVPSLLISAAKRGPDHPALKVRRSGAWQQWTYGEYLRDVRLVAKAFLRLGLQRHHAVAVIGFNSPEWFMADLGAVFAGALAVGIYPTNSPETCKYIAVNCRANIAVVEDDKQLEKVLSIRTELPHLKAIVQYTGTPKAGAGVLGWTELLELGRRATDDDAVEQELESRLKSIAINQCCHLVYTSGTTGPPKGVMLSHDNLTFTARVLCETFELKEKEERLVSYLPLSHVAANILDIFVVMACVSTTVFADKNALKGTLTTTLQEALPTLFFGVPRVWEKIQERMLEVGKQNKGLKRQIGTWAKKTGLKHNRNLVNGQSQSSLQYTIANMVVFQKVKAALGLQKCSKFYVAAAPMSVDTIEYFMSLDIRILEIYGMSEVTGPHTANTKAEQRIGSVGKSLPGFHTKVSASTAAIVNSTKPTTAANGGADAAPPAARSPGELCFKGRNVMMGYLFSADKTTDTFDADGWLKSGDIGIDDGGFITITGRIKELIITAGGENIPPVLIEDVIKRELPCLSNAMVIGDRRKFLACLLTFKVETDPDTLEPQQTLAPAALEWVREIESKAETVDDIIDTPDKAVYKAIQEGIDRANREAASSAQCVQKWLILPKDFSVPGGELGPTLKMKRHLILEKYGANVEEFYTA